MKNVSNMFAVQIGILFTQWTVTRQVPQPSTGQVPQDGYSDPNFNT
jgi:hypothetical protein